MQNNHSKKIGLIISGKYEALSFLRYISVKKKMKLGKYTSYKFNINKYEVLAVVSGKQMKKASDATKILIEEFSPALIISLGCGAAVVPGMRVGDVVYGNLVTMLEDGVFEQYQVLSSLQPDIHRLVFDIVFGFDARMLVGTIITVNNEQPILHHDKLDFSHPVLDLEMLGIAQVTSRLQVPTLALRGITHNLSKEGIRSLHTILDFTWNYDKKGAIFRLVEKPWLLLQLPSYLKQKIRASHHIASTTHSILQVLSFDYRSNHEHLDYTI